MWRTWQLPNCVPWTRLMSPYASTKMECCVQKSAQQQRSWCFWWGWGPFLPHWIPSQRSRSYAYTAVDYGCTGSGQEHTRRSESMRRESVCMHDAWFRKLTNTSLTCQPLSHSPLRQIRYCTPTNTSFTRSAGFPFSWSQKTELNWTMLPTVFLSTPKHCQESDCIICLAPVIWTKHQRLQPNIAQRSSSSYLSSEVPWPHHWCTHQPSLVAGPRAHTVQARCSDVQGPTWRWSTRPRRWSIWSISVAFCWPIVLLCHQLNCLQSAVEPSRSPLPNIGTACLTTSFWLIRCRPFVANWNIICSSSPTQMSYCKCCPSVLLWHS